MDKMRMESVDMTAQNIDKIGALFPNCITETKDENGKPKKAINFDILKQMLSGDVIEGDEAYEFTWVGKKESIIEANKPIRKTLRPCKEESVDWDNTENLYIEGDNLDVLKLMQESYLGKVKMIYIDPPYNTGNDFIYNDDFKMSVEDYADKTDEVDKDGNRIFKNTETNGRFHSDWCSMIYSRLMVARNLLSDDGVIFISIDDNEVYNLNKICDEVFGKDNLICNFIRKNKVGSGHDSGKIAIEYDYVLCYAKYLKTNNINQEPVNTEVDGKYKFEDEFVGERGKYYLRDLDYKGSYSIGLDYPITTPDGDIIYSGGSFGKPNTWRWSKEKFEWGLKNGYIVFKKKEKWKVYIKQYQFVDNSGNKYIRTLPYRALIEFLNGQGTNDFNSIMETNAFSYPKPVEMLKHLLKIASNSDSIILDFFSGSATTAHAVMQLNAEDGGHRKFIMVQLPEKTDEKSEAYKAGYKNICEIGKERIRRAGKKIKEENPNIKNLDIGFRVFKIDDTNMKDVYYSPDEYSQDLLSMVESNIKPDRTDLDLFFGCLLEWGLPLSLPYISEKIEGCTVHTYNDGDLIACFDENIPESVIEKLAARQPLRAVFRDRSFSDSPSKISVGEQFKRSSPDTRVKVI